MAAQVFRFSSVRRRIGAVSRVVSIRELDFESVIERLSLTIGSNGSLGAKLLELGIATLDGTLLEGDIGSRAGTGVESPAVVGGNGAAKSHLTLVDLRVMLLTRVSNNTGQEERGRHGDAGNGNHGNLGCKINVEKEKPKNNVNNSSETKL